MDRDRRAYDFGFDYDIVRTADQDKVFDIVAASDNELAPPIERESLHNAKTPRIAGFRHAKPAPSCFRGSFRRM